MLPDTHRTEKAFTGEETGRDRHNESLLGRRGIGRVCAGSSAAPFPSDEALIKTSGRSQTESSLLCVWLRMGSIKVTARAFKNVEFYSLAPFLQFVHRLLATVMGC